MDIGQELGKVQACLGKLLRARLSPEGRHRSSLPPPPPPPPTARSREEALAWVAGLEALFLPVVVNPLHHDLLPEMSRGEVQDFFHTLVKLY